MCKLECCIRMSCIREKGALPFQHIGHAFQKIQKAKSQGCLAQTVQFLGGRKIPLKTIPILLTNSASCKLASNSKTGGLWFGKLPNQKQNEVRATSSAAKSAEFPHHLLLSASMVILPFSQASSPEAKCSVICSIVASQSSGPADL